MSEPVPFDRTAATAHVRLDGHESLCAQEARHTQRTLEAMTEAMRALTNNIAATNARVHERIDKLMWGVGKLAVMMAGGVIVGLAKMLWDVWRP